MTWPITPRLAPLCFSLVTVCCLAARVLPAQVVPGTQPEKGNAKAKPYTIITPAVQPTLSPEVVVLLELESRFAQSVAAGGGKAFASWFADDAVVLNDGKPVVQGRGAITAQATWDPKTYSLTWVAQGARMGPSGDMGFTWGHYDGRTVGANGQATVKGGRYMTIWKKMPDGSWKVAMDASASEPASAADCCTVPQP